MKKCFVLTLSFIMLYNTAKADVNSIISNLNTKISAVQESCSGIKKDFDTIFGLSVGTAVSSGLGTLAAGSALAVGIVKAKEDEKIEKLELIKSRTESLSNDPEELKKQIAEILPQLNADYVNIQKKINEATDKSKQLGHARTGLMAGATATSAVSTGTSVGAVITADKLAQKIEKCNADLQALKIAKGKLEAEGGKSEQAENIIKNCTGYDKGNITALKNLATANAVLSGVGTATALTGTITSAIANTDKVRNDNSEKGKKKEKNLNLVSNVFAGITTGTSVASTGLSVAQITKAKKDSEMAEKCEGVLQ